MTPLLAYILLSLLTLGVCLFAMWKGGPGERYGAAVILGVIILQRLSVAVAPDSWRPIIGLCADASTALGLLALTLWFASPWLGAVMLFYAAQFTLHSVYLVTGRPHDALHMVVNNLDFAGTHLCLVVGTVVAWRRRVRAEAELAAA